MDKIKIGVQAEGPAEVLRYHGAEDVILEKLHRCTDGDDDCTPHDAEIIHKDFETCESYVLYDAYTHNRIPTFARMEEGMARLLANIPENLKDDPEAKRIAQLLKGRVLAIRGFVRSYVESILKFIRSKQSLAAQFHRNKDEYSEREEAMKSDHERRRRHESLLRTLSETSKLVEEACDYGICEKSAFYQWLPGETNTLPEDVIPVFSSTAIANRDLIKNWALAADFAEHYRKLKELLEAKK